MRLKLVLMTVAALPFVGCVAPPAREMQAEEAELANIRVVPASQVNSCAFITQTNILQGQSFFGGQAELAGSAEKRMKAKALSLGADTMVISDRIYDDGAGTGKQPTLSLFADLYRCQTVSASRSASPEAGTQSIKTESFSESVSKPAPVSKNILLEVQSKLKAMGFYAGAIDGIYGRESAKALRAFQENRNLPASGNVDSATLDALGISR